MTDSYDNPIPASFLDTSTLVVRRGGQALDCQVLGVDPARVACQGTVRGEGLALEAEAEAIIGQTRLQSPLFGTVEGLSVRPGELSRVDVFVSQTQVAVDEPFSLGLVGRDAYGNSIDPEEVLRLNLRASPGGSTALSPNQATLGVGSAERVLTMTLQQAGSVQVEVWRQGARLGQSEAIAVSAGEATALRVVPEGPWGFVGDTEAVQVEVVDAYGNRTREQRTVRLSSTPAGAMASIDVITTLGVGVVERTWALQADEVRVQAEELGTGTPLQGESDPFSIYQRCSVLSGPTMDVRFANRPYGVTCLDEATGEIEPLTADLSGCVARSGRTLVGFGVEVDGGGSVFSETNDQLALPELPGAGRHLATALAVQSDGCASEQEVEVWVGPDDGSVVGPLTWIADAPTVSLASTLPQTAVHLQSARTCDGLQAADAPVRVWATHGRLLDVEETGTGLQVTIDRNGEATVRLAGLEPDVDLVLEQDGVSVLRSTNDTQTAWGEAEVRFHPRFPRT